MPPVTPEYARVIMGSAATLRPTCFMNTNDFRPEEAAAAETSMATFSFVENSKYMPASDASFSRRLPISEEGVPGYVDAKSTPASNSPLTMASLPRRSCFPSLASKSDIAKPQTGTVSGNALL